MTIIGSGRAAQSILVVDDESQITRVLRTALAGHGYNVRTAGDGDEALEVMRQWTPDLVITDLSMPNMGGLELCRRIRSKSSVPIIVLSVRGEEKSEGRGPGLRGRRLRDQTIQHE